MKKLAESPYRRRGQRAWTPAQRTAQAMRIREQQPWRTSTGPRTPSGKARACANALHHGLRSRPMRALSAALTAQRRSLRFRRAFSQNIKLPVIPAKAGTHTMRNHAETAQHGTDIHAHPFPSVVLHHRMGPGFRRDDD